MVVMGIDPSLTSLGLAYRKKGRIMARAIRVPDRGYARLHKIITTVSTYIDEVMPTMIAYEDYAMNNKNQQGRFDIPELGGALKFMLWSRGIDILLVPPRTLKLHIAGSGKAEKTEIADALHNRFNTSVLLPLASHDQYDAAGLMVTGEDWLASRDSGLPKALQGCTFVKSI